MKIIILALTFTVVATVVHAETLVGKWHNLSFGDKDDNMTMAILVDKNNLIFRGWFMSSSPQDFIFSDVEKSRNRLIAVFDQIMEWNKLADRTKERFRRIARLKSNYSTITFLFNSYTNGKRLEIFRGDGESPSLDKIRLPTGQGEIGDAMYSLKAILSNRLSDAIKEENSKGKINFEEIKEF